jgi:hypothetical protein
LLVLVAFGFMVGMDLRRQPISLASFPSVKEKPKENPSRLGEFPYLKAALEDYTLALRLAAESGPNMRHVVLFMHDALEFLLYEVLLARGADIYSSGQNTIGFDDALQECKKRGVALPLIGTVRTIQKHRGDAKHHAQTPHGDAAERLSSSFQIIFSIIAYENFGQVLPRELGHLLPFHLALFEVYRRERGQDWDKALTFGLRAFVHKRRAVYKSSDDYATHRLKKVEDLIGVLKATAVISATAKDGLGLKFRVSVGRMINDGDFAHGLVLIIWFQAAIEVIWRSKTPNNIITGS